MPNLGKKIGIFAATAFESLSLTGIAPFYPSIAESRGIPTWVIGMIFSAAPLMSLLWSPFVPRIMERFGRRFVLLMGLIWMGLGDLLMIFVIMTPLTFGIVVSFLGRMFVGMGYSWTITSTYAILTSDFPDEAAKMVAIIEIASGLGLTMAPSFGSFMFGLTNYSFACLSFTLFIIMTIPLLFILLGKMRKYEIIREKKISLLEILKKPVRNI
jgi:MFS family permease